MNDAPLRQLLNDCRHGHSGAQKRLFEQYRNRVFAVCLRYARDRPEAQDMLQEAFLTIFRDLHQYTGAGPFEAWMRRVSVRCALQCLRRKNPLRFAEDYHDLPANTFEISPDTELNSEAILHMVQQLPAGYRTVFNLHCLEGWSYPEIAEALGVSESSVRSQYTRACQRLRLWVEQILHTT
ncbi:MAG: RNA polymerase sigma factor [Saprospiraceae bacterium]|nr:RNA polymerase sigma factor [Saprospiraceae bacterium]